MLHRRLCLFLLLLVLFGTPLLAVEPYIPNQFFGLQDPFFSMNPDARADTDLYNPAQLARAQDFRARFSSAPDFWGYTQWSLGGSARFGSVVIGGSYLADEAGDLIATSLDSNGRPQADHGFADRNTRAQIAVGLPFDEKTDLGLRISATQSQVDSDKSYRLWADLGSRYRWSPNGYIGIYSDLLSQVSVLGSSTLASNGVSRIYIESGYNVNSWFGGISSNFDLTRLNLEYQFPSVISLTAMTLLRLKTAPVVRGYQIGTRIRLEQLQIDYRYVTILQSNISDSQHLFGVSYSL